MKKKAKCFICHEEINEDEALVFQGQLVHGGECIKKMIDEYNAVRNLQIRNKRLYAEVKRMNRIIEEIKEHLLKRNEQNKIALTNREDTLISKHELLRLEITNNNILLEMLDKEDEQCIIQATK